MYMCLYIRKGYFITQKFVTVQKGGNVISPSNLLEKVNNITEKVVFIRTIEVKKRKTN